MAFARGTGSALASTRARGNALPFVPIGVAGLAAAELDVLPAEVAGVKTGAGFAGLPSSFCAIFGKSFMMDPLYCGVDGG